MTTTLTDSHRALSPDPWAGYYLEWMWPSVFGREACTLPASTGAPVTHREAMARLETQLLARLPSAATARRRLSQHSVHDHDRDSPQPSPTPTDGSDSSGDQNNHSNVENLDTNAESPGAPLVTATLNRDRVTRAIGLILATAYRRCRRPSH